MLAAPDQAVHEHDFARAPSDRIDRTMVDGHFVVQQGDVRRETLLDVATDTAGRHVHAELALQLDQPRDAVAAAKDERTLPARSAEACGPVEHDVESA